MKTVKKALPRLGVIVMAVVFLATSELFVMSSFLPKASAASDVFRVTTYELQSSEFTGTTYTLTLNNDLVDNYFTMISGPSSATATRPANQDRVRVTADPHGNFGSSTSSDQIELSRGDSTNDWIGSLSVIECLLDCEASGFELKEILETSLPSEITGTLQTVTDTLSANYSANTVPFGARFGGGMTTSSSDADNYAVTVGTKISKVNGNEIQFERFGGETQTPDPATVTTYIVEWGSSWTVQEANVTGTNSGAGVDATSEYNTASISSVNRDNTWVWGAGFTRDDGLGDGALGQVITLGDGVSQNSTETTVAVGSEGGLISPGRDFQVYTMSNSDLAVDYQFRVRGDAGAGTGFQELDITIDSELNTETYDNASTSVQYTEGYRAPLFYNTSNGTGQAYSRTGAWGLRIDGSTNLNYWRAYAGQEVTGWVQIADFGDISFSNVDTRQQTYRWRDDSTDLNTTGGWLAAENTNISAQSKNTSLRLRLRVANHGTTPEDAARTYELQYASKFGVNDCSLASSWVGVSDASDAFELYDSVNISPDGESASSSLLSNGDGFSFVAGEGRENADTTGSIGPLSASTYTELEYAVRPTDDAITALTYCFRLFDTASSVELETYSVYPELTIESTTYPGTGLGEAGTFSSAVNGGWTNVSFIGNYTTPVVVGTTNSHNGQNALVFESRNVTSTSADMRVCESEGATSNGCDTHASETVGYMVIDASIASSVDGIEAGTFTASGEADTNSVSTSYSESFSSAPYVFANVNTVNSSEVPIEVVISSTSSAGFVAGICDHLQGSNDNCDPAHGNETVGWVAIEPGNEPFQEDFRNGTVSVGASTWTAVTFSPAFSSTPVLIAASQTDTGGQDVEIDEARNVTTTGADVRYCEIDTLDNCDGHNPDTVAWLAIEPGQFSQDLYLDQDGYRFYSNTNSLTPTTPLGGENTAIANVSSGDVIRIRMAMQAGVYDVAVDALDIKLQYGAGSDCSAVSWTDVGGLGSGTIWRGFNNATPTDGATLASSLLDGGANALETYEEANPTSGMPSLISAGNRGEWDWVVENNGASNFTHYCFRMVDDSGTAFNYSRYAELTTSSGVTNLSPNSPANLDQQKTSLSQITTGEVINETSVLFEADVSDQNTNDIVQLCVEVLPVEQSFTNTETDCGDTVVYSGSAVTADVTISGFEHARDYHWQARVKDAGGLYSSWVSFGGNSESESDFSIDIVGPDLVIYDGTTAGADIEYNDGSLDSLSANWEKTDGKQPSEVTGLVMWLDGDDVDANGTDPSNGSSISTWSDKSGLGNDVGGTGDATFDATEQAVAFSDDPQPFDDNIDRSGGDSSSHVLFSVVQGNANAATNHVWYETTTPRVSPAENGILGGGTSLSGNNNWSSHITSKKMVTLDYNSGGTSTGYLDRNQEYQFSETQSFANSTRVVIGDDTTGGNRLESGEFVHEILLFNQDVSSTDRAELWEYLQCKWSMRDCSVSYEYAIGTSPGATDIKSWTAIAGTSVSASSLTLGTSTPYFFTVKATDGAGNQVTSSSDGQLVAPSLTFSTSGSGVVFNNLNPGNSFTDTQTTVLTTSTNARNGYVVRMLTEGLLTNEASDTISNFDGGTYASPDEWQAGDRGYGYTSSDTLVQGVNLFSPGTCAGGGAPPCYASFSMLGTGDIVADNPGPVTGSPINNEQFTITHRVQVDPDQPPGRYETILILSATADY